MSDSLDSLLAGALHWVRTNSGYLDTDSARAELARTPRTKAILQLGLLHYHWAKLRPADAGRAGVAVLLGDLWQRQDFARLVATDPKCAQPFGLMYAAIAPGGAATELGEGILASLAAEGFLTAGTKSAYDCLATRFYADVAGARHEFAPYLDLYYATPLGERGAEDRLDRLDVCNVTHTAFYLSHFGFRDPGLDQAERDRALRILGALMDQCVARNEWDLTGKLMLAQFCLGGDPLHSEGGRAGLAMITEVQGRSGAIPGRSQVQRVPDSAPPLEFFRKSYQTTITMALMSLIVSPRD